MGPQAAVLLLLLLFVLSWAAVSQACSNSTYDSHYDRFPDCAKACLACPDGDYEHNFANNCDYANGDCCRSEQHLVIASTWECVRTLGCNPAAAQEAFDKFVDDCKGKKQQLAESDVPGGYAMKKGGKDRNQFGPLTAGEFAGVIVGVFGGILAIVTAIVTIKQYRKNHPPTGHERVRPVEVARESQINFNGHVVVNYHLPKPPNVFGRLLGAKQSNPWTISSASLPLIERKLDRNDLPATGRVQELEY